jgi:hypothetical protein
MKKMLVIGILASSLAFGAGASKAAQVITMQGLEAAMGMIQKGFLRDNASILKMGTQILKENLHNIDSFVIKSSAEGFDPKTYAAVEVNALSKVAEEITQSFIDGDKATARTKFDQTLSRCIACHNIIRK